MNDWLIGLAEECGRMALDFWREGFEVKTKPDGSPVTTADLAIDRLIHDEIKARFSNDCVLSEETPDDPNRLQAERVWIADPIDGTAHFANRRDGFSTLIALCVNGVSEEAVAHFPALGLTLYAKLSEGAYVNRRRVFASKNHGANAKIAAHAPRFSALHSAPAHYNNNAIAVFKTVTGEIDGCVATTTPSTGEHDYAWASCAIESAGGKLTDLSGAPLRFNKAVRSMPPVLVCSNGYSHDELLNRTIAIEERYRA